MFAGPQMKALSSRMSQVNGFAITVCFVTLLVPLKWENSICPIPLPAGSTGDFVWFLQVRYRGGPANKLYRRFDLSIGQVRPELVWLLRDLFALPNYVVLASNDARCMYIGYHLIAASESAGVIPTPCPSHCTVHDVHMSAAPFLAWIPEHVKCKDACFQPVGVSRVMRTLWYDSLINLWAIYYPNMTTKRDCQDLARHQTCKHA